MPAAPAIATEARAGRVEPTRLAVRVREATATPPDESAALREAPFAVGPTRLGALELSVAVQSDGPTAHLDTTLCNASEAGCFVQSVVLGFRFSGPPSQGLRFLKNGWQSWSHTGSLPLEEDGEAPFPSGPWLRGLHHAVGRLPADREGWHESHLVTVVGSSPGGAACLAGVLERGRAFGQIYLRRNGGAVDVEIELRIDAELAAGRSRPLERVSLALGDDASALLEAFAQDYGRDVGARAAHPFVSGWCSWYHFFQDVVEEDLLRNLEALSSAREELPVEVVQLDDGWQRAVGDWLETNEKFPRGLASLAGEIRAAGFAPGLWTAPFCVVPESRVFEKHEDWLLRGADGPFRGLLNPSWSRDAAVYVLDASRPEVLSHLEGLYRSLVEAGFGYHKLDFLFTAALEAVAHDRSVSRASRLRRGLEAVRAGAGNEPFLLGCGSPLGPAVGLVDGMRIGPDVAPSWSPDESARVPGIEETQPATRSALRSALARAWMHRRLWLNDPDCLLARAETELSEAELRSLGAVLCATGGMTLFSDDVPRLSKERRAFVAATLEQARRVDGLGLPGLARVPDLLDRDLPQQVRVNGAGMDTVAIVNLSDEKQTTALELESPLSSPPRPLLGSRAPEEASGGGYELKLAAHDGALLQLRRAVPLAVFCDFDGTFSVQDVGATLATRHAGERRPALWKRYEAGEVTAWEYNMEILDGLALSRDEVDVFLHTVELDPGARDLVAWCERHGVPFRVLSDGFDYNLNRLQQLQGVRFAHEANRLRFDGGRWRIRAGAPNPDCECGCGTCKRGRIDAFRTTRPGVTTVHVGNGKVSDLCGALAADVAFAKDSLAEELARLGVGFEPFETLHDVIPALERLL